DPATDPLTPVGEATIRLEPDDASRSRLLRELSREDPERPRYAVAGEFARGGMAAILTARDRCLRRTLAMKVLLADRGADGDGRLRSDPRSLARFLEEAQITGQLDHPGIPPVHELGIDGAGRVYFTMPLIRGRNLSQIYGLTRTSAEGWVVPRAVGVLLRVCETVAYAHSRGVVHRDLKPANVMVGRFGETYVMDWGLARVRGHEVSRDRVADGGVSTIRTLRSELGTEGADSPLVTLDGHVIGTPAYMAPEQARGELERVGPHSDVYSIGAMLYELLAGHMPHVPAGVRMSARSVLARVVEGPPTPLREVAPGAPDELVSICERAMARAPELRFASVVELGDDLRAWLEGRVVRAHATGAWVELRKWIGRNRALAAASAALVVALLVALIVTIVLGGQANRAAARLAAELRINNLERGRLFVRAGNLDYAERLLWPEHVRTPESYETRWALWDLHARYPCLATAPAATPDDLRVGTMTSSDKVVAVGDGGGRIRLYETTSLRPIATLTPPDGGAVTAVVSDQAGERLYSAHADGGLYVWRLGDRTIERDLREPGAPVFALALDPTGRRLLAGTGDGALRIHETADWQVTRVARHPGRVNAVAWSPDGARIASLGYDWWARVFDVASGELVMSRRSSDLPGALLFAPDSAALLLGGNDRKLACIDIATGEDRWSLTKSDSVRALAVTNDGTRLLSCGWQWLDVWELPSLERLHSIVVPQHGQLLVDRAGEIAVTVHQHQVRAWDLANRGRQVWPGHTGRVTSTLDGSGRWIATGDSEGAVRLFDRTGVTGPVELGRHRSRVRTVVFNADGSRLVSGGLDLELRLWDVPNRRVLWTLPEQDAQSDRSACFSPDGRYLATTQGGDAGYAVVVRDVKDGAAVLTIPTGEEQALAAVFAPDGRSLAYTSRGHGIRICDLQGQQLCELPTDPQSWSLTFRPDGRKIATGTWGRAIRVFDVGSGVEEAVLEGHAGTVWSVCWAPDDPRLLYSAAADGSVRLWDLEQRRFLLELDPFEGSDALAVHVSDDGRFLVASGAHGSVFGWDLRYYERH
ncbi:MAG: protein kinase, partial [Planctomycetes bacterium]|nr:protein kinase [Planctomycetota bacterium]